MIALVNWLENLLKTHYVLLRGTQGSRPAIDTYRGQIGRFDLFAFVWTEIEGCHMSYRRVLHGVETIYHVATKGMSLQG